MQHSRMHRHDLVCKRDGDGTKTMNGKGVGDASEKTVALPHPLYPSPKEWTQIRRR